MLFNKVECKVIKLLIMGDCVFSAQKSGDQYSWRLSKGRCKL